MKIELYNDEGRMTEAGHRLTDKLTPLIAQFIEENFELYKPREIGIIVSDEVERQLLNKILGL